METDEEFLESLFRSVIVRRTKGRTNGISKLSLEEVDDIFELHDLLSLIYLKMLSLDKEGDILRMRKAIRIFLRSIKPAKTIQNARFTHSRADNSSTS